MQPQTDAPKTANPAANLMSTADDIARIDQALTRLLPASVDVFRAKVQARVDGQIIGTGKADFTQGNTVYAFTYLGRPFQLMDIPGIEGHEQRFTLLVSQAIAKAHLVFYVNGTNKKPEATTVRKIQGYLRRGSQVSVLLNVKEYPDAYEFEDDREDLLRQTGPVSALRQTEEVLAAALKPDQLMAGRCVQALLAFSALAFDPRSGQSTVHPSRRHDLAAHQRRFLQAFDSAAAMRRFSRIDEVAEMLTAKSQTFVQDIVEANKSKVRELLADTLQVLDATLQDHERFIMRVEAELSASGAALDQALESFSRLALAERRTQIEKSFITLDRDAQEMVATHFGDRKAIHAGLEEAFGRSQDRMVEMLQIGLTSLLQTLEADLKRAVERLLQNLQRADFERNMTSRSQESRQLLRFDASQLKMDLGLGGWGKLMLGMGSMAVGGAQIGMAYPPWGVFIGAGVGLIVGAVFSFLQVFSSKAEKVRKAQKAMQTQLGRSHDEAIAQASHAHGKLMAEVRTHVDAQVRGELEQLRAALTRPGALVEQQIEQMSRILRQVEDMPRGSVQAIRL